MKNLSGKLYVATKVRESETRARRNHVFSLPAFVRNKLPISVFLGLIVVSVFVAKTATAEDQLYFVNSAATGESLGTFEAPFHTIQEAADIVEPGDDVLVRGDSAEFPRLYEERVVFRSNPNSGTELQRISFRAYPTHSVSMYGFETGQVDYLTLIGFQITIPDWLIDEEWRSKYAVYIDSDYVEILDNLFVDIPGACISSDDSQPYPTGAYIADNYMYHVGTGMIVYGNDWLIENNEIERLVRYDSVGFDADYLRGFGNNLTFRYNYLHGTSVAEVGGSHVDGFQTFTNHDQLHGLVFDSNIVIDFHQGLMITSADAFGGVSDLTVTNNVFDTGNFEGTGIIIKYDVLNVSITHNLFANTEYSGVHIRSGAGAEVKNNIFYNAGGNYYADESSWVDGGYNLISDSGYPYYSESTDILDLDPEFAFPNNWVGDDGIPNTLDDGFRLLNSSPAIDTGAQVAVFSDFFGSARPEAIGGGIDIGPVEKEYVASTGGCSADPEGASEGSPLDGDAVLLGLIIFPFFRPLIRRYRA